MRVGPLRRLSAKELIKPEKTLMLVTTEGKIRKGLKRMGSLDSITNSMDVNLSKLGDSGGQGSLGCCCPRGLRVRHNLAADSETNNF